MRKVEWLAITRARLADCGVRALPPSAASPVLEGESHLRLLDQHGGPVRAERRGAGLVARDERARRRRQGRAIERPGRAGRETASLNAAEASAPICEAVQSSRCDSVDAVAPEEGRLLRRDRNSTDVRFGIEGSTEDSGYACVRAAT